MELCVGLNGTMNALLLKDLAAITHRGMSGRIRENRAVSGISYGYRLKREFDHRGGRQIVDGEANIVRKGFKDFADEKTKLEQQILLSEPTSVRFHLKLSEVCQRRVEKLHAAFKHDETRTSALELIRSLVEKIVVRPKEGSLSDRVSWRNCEDV
jgi:hypothetical protein